MPKLVQRIAFLFCSLFLVEPASAQSAQRYLNPCFDSIQVWKGVCYSAQAPEFAGSILGVEVLRKKDLKMDIFLPPASDTLKQRPLIILAHGGGFVDIALMRKTLLVGTRHNQDIQALADSLAHRGFVTASISYRLGFNPLSKKSYQRAVWRGAQDMSAAIRFFRENAITFRIDPEAVFVGGSSAGAICALHSCFMESKERLPSSRGLGPLHSRPVLKVAAEDYYKAKEVSGVQRDSLPNAIVVYWGGVLDTAYLRGAHQAPLLLFHGSADAIVPPETAKSLSGFSHVTPLLHGGISIAAQSQALGIPFELHVAQGEGHEYWGTLNGRWVNAGPSTYWREIVAQTAAFFVKYLP